MSRLRADVFCDLPSYLVQTVKNRTLRVLSLVFSVSVVSVVSVMS